MVKGAKMPAFIGVALLALAVLVWVPGAVGGEEGPVVETRQYSLEMDGEFAEGAEEKIQRKLDRIKLLAEEEVLDEEEAENYRAAIEEKTSFKRGECPEGEPRSCELRLELREHREECREEKREDGEAFRSGNGFKGGR